MRQHKLKINVSFSVSRRSLNLYFCRQPSSIRPSIILSLSLFFFFYPHTNLLKQASCFSFLLSYFFPTGTYLEEISHQTMAGTSSPPNTVKQSLFPQRIMGQELYISLFTRLHNSTYVQRHWKITQLAFMAGTNGGLRQTLQDLA